MEHTYSVYEAKAKLSEILRLVKRRQRVTITERGHPIARVVPFEERQKLADRLVELEGQGIVTAADGDAGQIRQVARKPGALRRFLEERD